MTVTADSLSELGGSANYKMSVRGQPFNHTKKIKIQF